MTWFPDVSMCDYFPFEDSSSLRAIGWLEKGHDFPTGSTPTDIYHKLKELLHDPWQPCVFSGFHKCSLCQFEGEAQGEMNLFIPGDGCVYVCPELILHYINAHAYTPPADFCTAVLACPDPRSIGYKKALFGNGLKPKLRELP